MKTNTIIKVLGASALIFGGAWLLTKSFKKEMKAIEKEEDELTKNLEELDLQDKDIDIYNVSADLPKDIYSTFCAESYGDYLVNINDVTRDRNSLRISQSVIAGVRFLDFRFEIPVEACDPFTKSLRISDYLRRLKQVKSELEEIIGMKTPQNGELEGYYILDFVNMNAEQNQSKTQKEYYLSQEAFRIPKYVYNKYKQDNHNGLTVYMDKLRVGAGSEEDMAPLREFNLEGDSENLYDIRIVDQLLFYRISFPIVEVNNNVFKGIREDTAIKCIMHIYEDVMVKVGYNKIAEYNRIMFNTRVRNGITFDPLCYYVYEKNKLSIDFVEYEEE